MNETKFTKHPMVVRASPGSAGLSDIYAILDNAPRTPVIIACDVRDANAHLFAAASKMYKALEQAVREVTIECEKTSGLMADEKYKFVNLARAVLAKARGES